MGQLQQQLDHLTITIRLRLVTIDRTAQGHHPTSQTFTYFELLTDAGN
jgi:hypothetical protein